MSTVSRFFDIRHGERRNTFAAFFTLLLVTTGHTLLETARDAFFLAKMPVARLPWMYLIIVVLALGLSQIRAARADSKWGVAGALGVGAVITTAFWTTMQGGTARPAVLYAIYVWTGLFGSWAMVQIWTLLGRTHTMTQAKRLYGFIGGGAVLGGVTGALLARVTISMMSPRSAVLMAAGLFVVAALPCTLIKLPREERQVQRRGTEAAPLRRPMSATLTLMVDNQFARRVLYIVLVSTITVTISDFLFKSQIAQRFDNTRDLGNWLSGFYAVTNSLAVIAQLAIAPWVFRRAGVQRALFVFPSLMLLAAGGVVLSVGAIGAAMVIKGLDGALRYSIHKTSTELLLVPVPDGTRERIKPIIDVAGSRGGQAIGSLLVIALVAAGGAATSAPFLGAVVLGLAFMWLVLAFTIRRHYLDVFRETLRSGGLSGKAELPELDLGALETLFAGLNSSVDQDVISALELLAEQHRERLIPALILYHPSKVVVLRALDIFQEMGRSDFVSIADRLNTHPDGEVAAAALRARTAVAPVKELLLARLGDRSPRVSVTALVALMARGWIDPVDADARVETVLESHAWETAAELARAIGIVAPRRGIDPALDARFDDLLVAVDAHAPELVDDEGGGVESTDVGPTAGAALALAAPAVRVRLEVALAMEARPTEKFLPVLVRMLNRHELRAAARAALVGIPNALVALDQAMATADLPRDIRVHLPRTVAIFEPNAASQVLMRHLATVQEGAVRFKIIRGLVKLRRNHDDLKLDPSLLTRVAERTLEHVEALHRWGIALARGDREAALSQRTAANPLQAAHHLLVDLVRDKETHALQRVFLILELISGDPFDDIWRGLRSKDPKSHASSLELLENLVQEPLKARVLALIGDAEPARPSRVSRPSSIAPPVTPEMTYAEAVEQLLTHSSSTVRILAEYRAKELGIDVDAVRRASRPAEPATSPLAASLGERLIDTVSELLTPEEPPSAAGATRAPA